LWSLLALLCHSALARLAATRLRAAQEKDRMSLMRKHLNLAKRVYNNMSAADFTFRMAYLLAVLHFCINEHSWPAALVCATGVQVARAGVISAVKDRAIKLAPPFPLR
jgi:hypothetical protein